MELYKKSVKDIQFKEEEQKEAATDEPRSNPLPEDLIFEILTRVSLNVLMRQCKFVCKDWYSLTYNFNFKKFHCERTPSVSGYIVQSLKPVRMGEGYFTYFVSAVSHHCGTLDFIPGNAMVEASCLTAQILLCSVYKNGKTLYYVCKPTIREYAILPNPKSRCITSKMAMKQYDHSDFKIIRFSWSRHNHTCIHWEMFDSKKWAWRKCSQYKKLPLFTFVSGLDQVTSKSFFYWQILLNVTKKILAFNIDCENWNLISLPEHLDTMNNDFRICKTLVDCEGDLGLMYSTDVWMELWFMEDYTKELWKQKYRLSLEVLNPEVPWRWQHILALYTMDVVLIHVFGKLIWYDCQRRVQIGMVEGHFESIVGVHAFQSDFEPAIFGKTDCGSLF